MFLVGGGGGYQEQRALDSRRKFPTFLLKELPRMKWVSTQLGECCRSLFPFLYSCLQRRKISLGGGFLRQCKQFLSLLPFSGVVTNSPIHCRVYIVQ